MNWEPTIGKWNDEDDYNLIEPLWKRMLNESAKYGDVKELQSLLRWLNNKNMYGDTIKIYMIAYSLCKAGVELKNIFALSDEIVNATCTLSSQSNSLHEYAVLVFKMLHVSDEIIEEFLVTKNNCC